MAITLATATTHLDAWTAADAAVALGQSYTIGDRTLTRVHASEIRNMINYWSGQEATLQRIANGQPSTGVSLAKFNGSSNP